MRSDETLSWLERPLRPFDVSLRSHPPGAAMRDAKVFTWHGSATDEAHAVTLAMGEAAGDGWTDTTSYRVCESVGFLPVAAEFGSAGVAS